MFFRAVSFLEKDNFSEMQYSALPILSGESERVRLNLP